MVANNLGSRIRKLHSQGVSYEDIRKTIGCSKDTIIKHLLKDKTPQTKRKATACKSPKDYNYIKTCIDCGESKPLNLFAKGKRYKDGRRNTCKQCHANRMAKYYKDNPDKYELKMLTSSRWETNWRRHRISEEYYTELMNKYEGKCHVCREAEAINIDHDHLCCPQSRSCGECVRGVLCHHCNTAMGLLKDNPVTLQNMLDYLSLNGSTQ